MATRFIFTKTPTIYHSTGLKLEKYECPCPKKLIEELLKDLLISWNPPHLHKRCTSLCGQPVQLVIGYPKSVDVKTSCSELIERKVEEYENDATNSLADEDVWYKEKVELHSLAIRFLPCVKVMEILDAALYL